MNETTQPPIYRIFLSSTAIDMEEHRKAVSDAIMRLGNLPVQMETFGAQPSEPVEVCKDKVRECDALVVMVAHRYGWVPGVDEGRDGHKSITWIEVETALEAGKPVFAFLVDMDYGWTQPKEQDLLVKAKTKEEIDEVVKKVQALEEFREYLDNEAGLARDNFKEPKDLAIKVATSLSTWAREPMSAPGKAPKGLERVFRVVHPLQPAPYFRGREVLLRDLREWWKDPVHPDRVRSLVAIGGTGKTAVIQRFLDGVKNDTLRGSILVWSFYEEPDTDAFLREANIVFAGEEGEGAGGLFQRLQRALAGSEPHLLVLDGLERMQSAGGGGRARGDLEDHRLKNLLRSIAGGLGRTRALITSRFKLTDLEQWEGAGYLSRQLDVLDEQAAVSVLEAWKVKGDEEQLQALAESVGRHALSVSVLGSYLNHFCDGDPKCADEFKLDEIAEDDTQTAKLRRILGGYAENLPDEERDLLVRLSVFPRGVSVDVLRYLIDEGGEIAGALAGIKRGKLIRLAKRLHKQGLTYEYQLRNSITYTAHPFLREYFRNLLGIPTERIHEAVRSKLATGLAEKPDTKPRDTTMLDRYETLIEHSILAGCFQEAFDLYHNAMGGGGSGNHLFHVLGDYGRSIRILSLFAKDGDPQNLLPRFSSKDCGYLLSFWGLSAHALGDTRTAEKCFSLDIELRRNEKEWEDLSRSLQNSAFTAMVRGTFPSARNILSESLKYAVADDEKVQVDCHAYLALTYHALGKIFEAKENFAIAMKIQGRPLYSYNGIYEIEHLFGIGEKEIAYKRVEALLAGDAPREIALCHTLLGLFSLPDSITEARGHLEKVREWTDRSGYMECIIRSHILAAEIAYCADDLPGALAEATAGLNYAEGCGYGQFAIDLLLLLAKIHYSVPDSRKALQNARKALDRSTHPECQYAWGEANALHICGICHKELGEPELAVKRLEAAYEVRKRIQHPEAKETGKLLEELKGRVYCPSWKWRIEPLK